MVTKLSSKNDLIYPTLLILRRIFMVHSMKIALAMCRFCIEVLIPIG
jgi:hypothetical protein